MAAEHHCVGQFCQKRKYLIRDVEGKHCIFWGEGDGERKGGNSDGEGKRTDKKNKKGEIVLHSTQPLAR